MLEAEGEAGRMDVYAYTLAGFYLVLAGIALVQLLRIQLRLPEYGWTTQKVFHLLNVLCLFARAALFGVFHDQWAVDTSDPPERPLFYFFSILFPGQIYYTTYTLLILFWAEIYHQARSLPLKYLRPAFLAVNIVVYVVPVAIAIAQTVESDNPQARHILKYAMASAMSMVWLSAAAGFAFYGGKLFMMLRLFPLESKGRRKKLQEVGIVAGVSTVCFVSRAALEPTLAFIECSLSVHFAYFIAVEILPVVRQPSLLFSATCLLGCSID